MALGKNVIEDYRDKIATAPAEAAMYCLMAKQCQGIHKTWAAAYQRTADGVLWEAERCRKVLERAGIAVQE
jgi:hypothetical protein